MCENGPNFVVLLSNMSNILLKSENIWPRLHPFLFVLIIFGQVLNRPSLDGVGIDHGTP